MADLCNWCGVPMDHGAGAQFRIRGGVFEAKGTVCMRCLKDWREWVDARKGLRLVLQDVLGRWLS